MQKKLRQAIKIIEDTKGAIKSKALFEARKVLEDILENHGFDFEELEALEKTIDFEMAGYFTIPEASAILDNLNGVYLRQINDYRYQAEMISHNISDGCSLEGLDKKWEIDQKIICDKVSKLQPHQTWWLIRVVTKFWNEQNGTWSNDEVKRRFRCK